jgi:hypothetical protein
LSACYGQSYNPPVKKRSQALVDLILAGVVLLLAAGCGRPVENAPEEVVEFTPFAGTPLSPIPTSTLTPAPPAVPSGPCLNDAEFLEDLTIPDLTEVEPGSELDKRWLVRNSGSCDWNAEYRLVNVAGQGFGGPDLTALFPARAGASAVWQVMLTAPLTPGEHISRWQAQDPDGAPFGDEVFLYIIVPTPTPAPTGQPTPGS